MIWYHRYEVRNMKFFDKIFGSPHYPRELLFIGKYTALLQFALSFFFCGLSRFGGVLGSLTYAEVFREGALVTLTMTLIVELLLFFLHRTGTRI